MGLMRWFTKNWANTHEPTHADLAPLTLMLSADTAMELVQKTVASLSNWRVEGSPIPGELHLTRRTRLFRFIDDVIVTVIPAGDGVALHARSKSRIGKGDLGQNRRNIRELWNAIQSHTHQR